MRVRSILPLALLLALLAAPAAEARYVVGMAEQSPAMFASPLWRDLHMKRVRYIVPWDWRKSKAQVAEIDAYLRAAGAARQEVLVEFTASRGCYENGVYSRSRSCRAPSPASYRRSVRRFLGRYPFLHVFAPWNEVNHPSQPTYRSPRRAAQYYSVLEAACRRCKVLGADVLDSSNARTYLRRFLAALKGRDPRLWGLHNYSGVNRRTSATTRAVLASVPGEVWLTETGGIVRFTPNFPHSEARAANRIKYMFRLADAYDARRRGLRSRITRLYLYQWLGVSRSARWDAGLVDQDGTARAGYRTFKRYAARRAK
jgi:hypothetical protein